MNLQNLSTGSSLPIGQLMNNTIWLLFQSLPASNIGIDLLTCITHALAKWDYSNPLSVRSIELYWSLFSNLDQAKLCKRFLFIYRWFCISLVCSLCEMYTRPLINDWISPGYHRHPRLVKVSLIFRIPCLLCNQRFGCQCQNVLQKQDLTLRQSTLGKALY